MTCIVAVKASDGTVYMGGDSGSFEGWVVYLNPNGKVWRAGEFLIGSSGDTRGRQLVQHAFKPPAIDNVDQATNVKTEGNLDEYMTTKFVNELRKVFKEAGFAQTKEGQELACAWLLVAVRGRMFYVDNDYCVIEDTHPYSAIGSGRDIAKGALGAIVGTGKDTEKQIMKALELAQEHCAHVRGPFTIISSKDISHVG